MDFTFIYFCSIELFEDLSLHGCLRHGLDGAYSFLFLHALLVRLSLQDLIHMVPDLVKATRSADNSALPSFLKKSVHESNDMYIDYGRVTMVKCLPGAQNSTYLSNYFLSYLGPTRCEYKKMQIYK